MADAPGGLTPDERAELERLRGEVAHLRRRSEGRGARAGRWVVAVVLLLISALLFATSIVAVFVRAELLDTNRYVATVAPLARDPAIQDAITNRITNAVVERIDLTGLAEQLTAALKQRGVPPAIDSLVGPVVNGVTSFIRTEVHNVVSSDQFAQFWDNANRVGHDELAAVLTTGKGRFLTAEGTEVSLDLGAVLELVKQRLVEEGFSLASKIPKISLSLPLVTSEKLPRIRTYVSWLDTAAWLLPLLALVMLVAGILVAPKRRQGLVTGAVMAAVVMLILLAGLRGTRTYYLNHLPDTVQSPAAVQVMYDSLTRFLIRSIQTLFVFFLIVAVLAWLAGPSRPATVVKHLINAALDGLAWLITRTGMPLGPVPGFLRRTRRVIATAVVLIALAILVIWREPGIAGVLWVTAGALLVLGLVEIVARTEEVGASREATA